MKTMYNTSLDMIEDFTEVFNKGAEILAMNNQSIEDPELSNAEMTGYLKKSGTFIRNINNIDKRSNFYEHSQLLKGHALKLEAMIKDKWFYHEALVKRFPEFLVSAKTNAYGAAPGASSTTFDIDEMTKEISYTHHAYPEYKYVDVYSGAECFFGRETVYHHGVPEYSMSYGGKEYVPFKNDEDIYKCLSKALMDGPVDSSRYLRGKDGTRVGDYVYIVDYNWNSPYTFCTGTEYILRRNEEEFNSLKHEAAKMNLTVVEYVTRQFNTLGARDCEYIVFQCQFQGGVIRK